MTAAAMPLSRSGHRPVLVVDDDQDVRESVADVLRDEGYEVVTMPGSLEAVGWLRSETPCLVLLDLWMPDGPGEQVHQHMRNHPSLSGIPVVVISAAADGKTRAENMGADFLGKPLRLDRLLDVVRSNC